VPVAVVELAELSMRSDAKLGSSQKWEP